MEFLFNVKSFFFKKGLIFFRIFSQEIASFFILLFDLLASSSLKIYALQEVPLGYDEIQKDN
jgi:hypothetical protein